MNNKYINDLIQNYGITDPIPVIDKINKNNARAEEVFNKTIKEMQDKRITKNRIDKAEKILNKKK